MGIAFIGGIIMNQKLNDLWEKYYKKVYDIDIKFT